MSGVPFEGLKNGLSKVKNLTTLEMVLRFSFLDLTKFKNLICKPFKSQSIFVHYFQMLLDNPSGDSTFQNPR